jgi:hypothetical protein
MYIELPLLFIIYVFSCLAIGISLYALWTLKEIEEFYKKKNSQPKYRSTAVTVTKEIKKPKNHWG